jgi:hypothetical protein
MGFNIGSRTGGGNRQRLPLSVTGIDVYRIKGYVPQVIGPAGNHPWPQQQADVCCMPKPTLSAAAACTKNHTFDVSAVFKDFLHCTLQHLSSLHGLMSQSAHMQQGAATSACMIACPKTAFLQQSGLILPSWQPKSASCLFQLLNSTASTVKVTPARMQDC